MEKYLPSRKALAGRLFKQEYEKEKAQVISRLRDELTLALISDGWTNTSKEKIVNYVLVPVVFSMTTDSAPVMPKAWEILERERPIFCHGCSSHALNLILEEVMRLEWMSWALTRSVAVAKFIRNRSQLLARFQRQQKKGKEEHQRALRLPVLTRWYSSYECIKSIVDNRSTNIDLFKKKKVLKKRFGRSPAKLNEARDIVENKAFWSRTNLVASLMKPFVDAIAVLERDSCCVSMVYWQFSQLRREPIFNQRHSSIPVLVRKKILKSITDKWAFLHTDTIGISFLLDQTKKTADFVEADLAVAVESVKEIAVRLKVVTTPAETEQIGNEACAFYLKKDRWSSQTRARQGGLSPIAWWSDKVNRTSTDDDYYPLLAPLAVKIYTIPTSSAASERSWSIHDFIHTKRRNRLDAERVETLVYIYCNAGNKDSRTSILYTIDESQSDDEDEDEDEEMDEESGESSDCSGNVDGYDSKAFSYDGSEEQKSKI
ncbi:hypothetical protein PHMEG_00017477 [Phytophthora megakarya]|uniref:HAT C-terminal dimerisation domain-containing protein n=1 Tax=Phytophthora megakarya TaxID=4795 RepID=A0A225VWE5_9STRA|nr:hypothetical protein PHMEG_00017477 [Phytophthora megakarya]